MKKIYTTFLALFLGCCQLVAQTTTSATYTSGTIPADFVGSTITTSTTSNCAGTLHVPVPAGRYVTSVDIEYDIQAVGTGWMLEQQSYVECATKATTEGSVYAGPTSGTAGTYSYSRTGLTFANGTVPTGGLDFKLHVFRTWGSGGCNTTYQLVPTGTFKVTVTHLPALSCPEPSGLSLISAGVHEATVGWSSGGASNWQIEYGPVGFAPGTGTVINAGTNPFTITGLAAATSYQFRVRDSCGVGDVSPWSPMAPFTTNCTIASAPWSENFESSDWQNTGTLSLGTIDTCFDRNEADPYTWIPGPSVLHPLSGPAGDHTTGNGKYMFAKTLSFTTSPFGAEFITPEIDLSPLSIPQLRFWYHMYGSVVDDLEVLVSADGGVSYNSLLLLNGQQQNSQHEPWKEAVVSLASYANDTVLLKFEGGQILSSSTGYISIDDISVIEAPTCPKPSNLSSVASSDGFVLDWTTGGASNWQIEYGPRGFAPGSGTLVHVSSKPVAITGLTANTIYDIYLRDSCAATDVSLWLGPKTDTTLCLPFSAPFFDDFEDVAWGLSHSIFYPGDIHQCWDRSDTAAYHWRVGQGATSSGNTGPSGDHTSGTGKYVFGEIINLSNVSTDIVTPLIDCSSLTVPHLSFWYHMYGNNIDKMEVHVWESGTWTLETTISGQQQNTSAAPWRKRSVDLSAYANDTIRVKFKAFRTPGAFADMAIDDVLIDEAPSCLQPYDISVTANTINSITLDWTTGGASEWLVGYRLGGSTAPLTIVPVSTKPFVITGLSPSASYEIYVKDSCAAGDVSVWTGPHVGTTVCGVAMAPWGETFDGPSWVSGTGGTNNLNQISPCWTRPSAANPHFGTRSGTTLSVSTGPGSDVSGSGKYLYTEASGAGGAGEITSPSIGVPTTLYLPQLIYDYHMYGNNIQHLKVEVNNGTGFTTLRTFTGPQHNSNSDPWKTDTVDLSSYSGDTIQIRFVGSNNGFNGDVAIDEVAIIPTFHPCPPPTGLTVSNIQPWSADFGWSSGSGMSIVRLTELGQPLSSGDSYANVASPLNFSGLVPGTSYEIHVRDSCGPGLFSTWVTDTFTTPHCDTAVAGFSFLATELTVDFNSATSTADSLYWDFGDGNNISGADPSHSYATAGVYTVTLIGINHCGTSDTAVQSFRVCDSVEADFSYNRNVLTVNFSSAGSTADSLHWYFGDGKDTATVNPSHTFAAAGTYNVVLIAFNQCGGTDTVVKNVQICDTLTADFSAVQSGDTILFDGTISKGAVNYYWDLGNGSDTAGAQFGYLYGGASNRIVELTVVNACGDSSTVTKVVKVCLPPVASWTYEVIRTTGSGMEVQFDGSASKNAVSFEWDFGDGNTASGAVQPVHTYITPGLFYRVKLTVTNDCGDKNTRSFRMNEIGLPELALLEDIQVYPNPADDRVEVEWPGYDLAVSKIKLVDVSGRVLREYSIRDSKIGNKGLDISSLAEGYYTLRIFTDEGTTDRALIVQ